MVLESEITMPSTRDTRHSRPSAAPIPNPHPIRTSTCTGVPMSAIARTSFSSLKEKSSPIEKRSSATPISARSSMRGMSDTVTPPV